MSSIKNILGMRIKIGEKIPKDHWLSIPDVIKESVSREVWTKSVEAIWEPGLFLYRNGLELDEQLVGDRERKNHERK